MHEDYVRRCENEKVELGKPYLFRSANPPWILNFPTKDHWRSVSSLFDIVKGLEYLEQHYVKWGIRSLAVPPLGCGLGQLEWRVVGPTLYRHLEQLDLTVELYAPFGTPHEELQPTFLEREPVFSFAAGNEEPSRTIQPAWVALVAVLKEIEKGRYHHPVGRTSFQKIAYFATESGIPTGLTYQRGNYGPYAPELKGVITRLVNNGLIREERLGRMFAVKTGPTFLDAYRGYEEELSKWESQIELIADFFSRMNTSQAELAATVHFAAKSVEQRKNESIPTESEVLTEVMNWKQSRRSVFTEERIAAYIRALAMMDWLKVVPNEEFAVSDLDVIGV